jgi:hypothetical protein
MISQRAGLIQLLSLIMLAVAGVASAQEGCQAVCTCPCQSDTQQCTVLVCASPAVASCQDGSCGGLDAKCCCRTPGELSHGCVPYDCGDWPAYQCVKSGAAGSGAAKAILSGPADFSRGQAARRAALSSEGVAPESCRALRQMNPEEDLWSYAELAPATKGGVRRYQVRFASDPDYALGLQRCADLGLAFDEDQETGDKPEFLFRVRAPRGSVSPEGLSPALHVPDGSLGALSGVAAIRLDMTGAGRVLSKRLLFTTDARLGEALLLGIDGWFDVAPGTERSAFEEILFLKVEAGKLDMAVEHHHSRRATAA